MRRFAISSATPRSGQLQSTSSVSEFIAERYSNAPGVAKRAPCLVAGELVPRVAAT
jgi:hypothetical protein